MAYTKTPSGRLQRLTVAVLIDNLRTTGADGKVKATPLTPQQLEHVTALVKDAVGFNSERGDSVNVVNSPFREETVQPAGELEQIPLWERPMVRDIAKLVVGMIVLLVLVLAVLRPLTRGLLGHGRGVMSQAALQAEAAATAGAGGAAARVANGTLQQAPLAYEQQLAQAKTLVGQDPKRVAQVVRAWVAKDE
jgi:flagellar M-ring protein FliF